MKNEEVKIGYVKVWNNEGTVYRGRFNITKELYNNFKVWLEGVKPTITDTYQKLYINVPLNEEGECVFLNITQTNFFTRFMKEKDIPFNKKRAFGSFNYYLNVA